MSVGGLKVAVPADAAARGVARVGIAEVGAERSQQVDACDGRRRVRFPSGVPHEVGGKHNAGERRLKRHRDSGSDRPSAIGQLEDDAPAHGVLIEAPQGLPREGSEGLGWNAQRGGDPLDERGGDPFLSLQHPPHLWLRLGHTQFLSDAIVLVLHRAGGEIEAGEAGLAVREPVA